MLESLAVERLQGALNHALAFDPASRLALAQLAGRSLGIRCQLPPLSLGVTFLATGDISLSADPEGPLDVTLEGGPVALALLLARGGDTLSFAGSGVTISGDQELLLTLAKVITNLDIDWEHALAAVIGDTPAHLAGTGVRNALAWQQQAASRSASGVGEYLREESGFAVGGREAADWFRGVQHLAADSDRLAARVKRLEILLTRAGG